MEASLVYRVKSRAADGKQKPEKQKIKHKIWLTLDVQWKPKENSDIFCYITAFGRIPLLYDSVLIWP